LLAIGARNQKVGDGTVSERMSGRENVAAVAVGCACVMVGVAGALLSWRSLGLHEEASGFLWRPARYNMYKNGLLWQLVDIAAAAGCGFVFFGRLAWLVLAWCGALFRLRIPASRLGKHDWLLLGMTGVSLVAVFMLANEGFPPW
jgi:hypothetical protein